MALNKMKTSFLVADFKGFLTNDLFLYVRNNPINHFDQFGLAGEDIIGNIVTASSAVYIKAAQQAGFPVVAVGILTIGTSPLSDILFPSSIDGSIEKAWLLNRELKEFRRVMEEAKRELDEIEKQYESLFKTFSIDVDDECE